MKYQPNVDTCQPNVATSQPNVDTCTKNGHARQSIIGYQSEVRKTHNQNVI